MGAAREHHDGPHLPPFLVTPAEASGRPVVDRETARQFGYR